MADSRFTTPARAAEAAGVTEGLGRAVAFLGAGPDSFGMSQVPLSAAGEPYTIPLTTLEGAQTTLGEYRDRALLIVNVASQCGFTPQYEGLEALHREYAGRGLAVLGFPCNQFGGQEPGSAEEIREFCSTKYQVGFPLFAKIDVNGAGAHPLYELLKARAKGLLGTAAIKWNFTKFLVGPNALSIERFAPNTTPQELRGAIEGLLPADSAPAG